MNKILIFFVFIFINISIYSVYWDETWETTFFWNNWTPIENNNQISNSDIQVINLWNISWAIPWWLDRISSEWIVSNLNSTIFVNISWDAYFRVNSWSFTKSANVSNGDIITIKISPSTNYSEIKKAELIIWNTKFVFSIETIYQNTTSTNNNTAIINVEEKLTNCSDLPINAKWNWITEFKQTKIWNVWIPAFVSNKYEAINNLNTICSFTCNEWFNWKNWYSCEKDIIEIKNLVTDNMYNEAKKVELYKKDVEINIIEKNDTIKMAIKYQKFKNKKHNKYNLLFENLSINLINRKENKWKEDEIITIINRILILINANKWAKKWTTVYNFSIKAISNNIILLKQYIK